MNIQASRRALILTAAATAIAGILPSTANANTPAYPTKVIRMVVAFPAGGPTDVAARLVAQKLSERLGQQVIVENKAGASGSVGTAQFIREKADGYTVSMFGMPALIAPIVYGTNTYDVRKDFTPVSTVYDISYVMVINPKVLPNVQNLQDFIAHARQNPTNYTSPGAGSIGHLSVEILQDLAKIKMEHISYKGSAPAMNDLLGGQVPMMFGDLIAAMPHIQSGRLKAIALSNKEGQRFLPNVKAISEQGYPTLETSTWAGLVVPNGTPQDVITRLDAELKIVLADPDTIARMEKIGASASYQPSATMKQRLTSEYERWLKVATDKGIRAE